MEVHAKKGAFKDVVKLANKKTATIQILNSVSDFAGDLEHSKSTSGGILCIFGSRTFVPISWMCKKQTLVSHSSTESKIISLDAVLRMDVLPKNHEDHIANKGFTSMAHYNLVLKLFLCHKG